MGLGLHLTANVKKNKEFRKGKTKKSAFQIIEKTLLKCITDELFRCFFYAMQQDELLIFIHPAAEPAAFTYEETGTLTCWAKTSTAGPGYHAFLTELLEQLAQKLGFQWDGNDAANDANDNSGDDTGYIKHKDYAKLQLEMLTDLRSLASGLAEKKENDGTHLSLPVGFHVAGDFFAVSPLGFWEKEWFQQTAETEPGKLHEQGDQFFPWWQQGMESEFWFKMGSVMMWTEIAFRPPEDLDEAAQYQMALLCFQKSKSMDPERSLPEKEIRELAALEENEDHDKEPAPDGIGFLRGNMVRSLTDHWTITVPGYFYDEITEDDGAQVYRFGNKSVCGSSVRVQPKENGTAQPNELIGSPPEMGEIVHMETGFLKGWAQVLEPKDGNGETNENGYSDLWILKGKTAADNNLCTITITFDNPEDKEWAVETWRSTHMHLHG